MATAASPVTSLCEIEGRAAPLLTAERTALNFLQRLSGIATMTRKFVDAAGGRIIVLDTRKTTPTLRVLEEVRGHGPAVVRITAARSTTASSSRTITFGWPAGSSRRSNECGPPDTRW